MDTGETPPIKETVAKPVNDLIYMLAHVYKPLEKNENFKKNLEKFEYNLKNSLEQVENKFQGTSLELRSDMSDEEIAKDPEWMKKLDKLLDEWTINIDRAINSATAPRNDIIKSASLEIDNRRRIVSNLSMIDQLLNSETVKKVIDIMDKSDLSTKKEIFEQKKSTFLKHYEDAVDYLKFLTTLERSIKDLSSDDLGTINHSIPGIFHNLKIISMISKHKEHGKFGFLMEVMAREICDKISERIKLKEIFKDPDESIKLISQAKIVCDTWIQKYNETKNKAKWTYQAVNITGGVTYISKQCSKLQEGLINIKDFLKFLGPELKRVIGGSSEKIDIEKEKVYKAYAPIENYQYSMFDKKYEESTNNLFTAFHESIKELEKDTISLIDQTFDNLKNAESAFDLYINFENLIKQQNIKAAMNKKYINILEKLTNEIKGYKAYFESLKDNPPISKAKCQISGKIAWARLLYTKMKKPMHKIFEKNKIKKPDQNQNILNTQQPGSTTINDKAEKSEQEVAEDKLRNTYFEIAKKLKNYEMEIFEQWKKKSEENFKSYLQNTILKE
jgi:dynein heavy chain